jgi:hypothetical protein
MVRARKYVEIQGLAGRGWSAIFNAIADWLSQ